MGYCNLTNISEFFRGQLSAHGAVSIRDCAARLAAAGEAWHASEGPYDEENLANAVNILVSQLHTDGWIEPVLDGSQDEMYRTWRAGLAGDWANADYADLDAIPWRATGEVEDIPVVGAIEL